MASLKELMNSGEQNDELEFRYSAQDVLKRCTFGYRYPIQPYVYDVLADSPQVQFQRSMWSLLNDHALQKRFLTWEENDGQLFIRQISDEEHALIWGMIKRFRVPYRRIEPF